MTRPSAEFAARVTEQANPWTPDVPEDAAVAARPELDGVTEQTTAQVEGVDTESMPALRDMRHALPSERARIQAALMKVAKAMPKEWIEAGADGIESQLADGGLDKLDPDTFVAMFEQMEQLVFQSASNPDEMREWIVAQDNPTDALTYAFQRVSETAGN